MITDAKKIAVFLPGIGYTHDKPLLYYSEKMFADNGYETVKIEYHDLPGKVRGDKKKLLEAAVLAYTQTEEQLKATDFSKYKEVVFVGKSVGTVIVTKYTSLYVPMARKILYTPVEATFKAQTDNAVAFLGTKDPWSDFNTVVKLSKEADVPMYIYEECNHSLEREGRQLENIKILGDVMQKTEKFMWG